MFAKKLKAIVAVHDDSAYWVTCGRSERGHDPVQLPLEPLLSQAAGIERIPAVARGNFQSLWIVPDHWFGMERYPFQSDKAAMIVPFLERKLAAAHPECKQVRQFFNYQLTTASSGGRELLTYFLQDEKAYRLYDTLSKSHLAPRYITTPAFLWVDRLRQILPDFSQEGTLLIHAGQAECQLYFYFKGNHLFSRNVILSNGPDRMEALTFEINQSLYMFSQKTKNELSRILVWSTAAGTGSAEDFKQAIGRDVTDLGPLLGNRDTIEIQAVPLLEGLLSREQMFSRPPFFSVTQRQVRHELAWEPVQLAGVAIGMALLLPLIAENLLLGHMLRADDKDRAALRRQTIVQAIRLNDFQNDVTQVLEAKQRPQSADIVQRLLASLPAGMRVHELGLNLAASPVVTLKAALPAEDAEQLKASLTQMVMGLKSHFTLPDDFSLNNLEISSDPLAGNGPHPKYLVGLRLELR